MNHSHSTPLFTIVIVNYKSNRYTINCLISLKKFIFTEHRIVIVDNSEDINSQQELLSNIRALGLSCLNVNIDDKDIQVEQNIFYLTQSNKGFAAANNSGIVFSKNNFNTDWFWLLNNDTEVKSDILHKISIHISKLDFDNSVGILGNDLFYLNNQTKIQGIGAHFNWFSFGGREVRPDIYTNSNCNASFKKNVDYIIGASMFVSNNFINAVGLMNEIYFLYYEEIDWAIRAKRKGYKLGYCYGAIVYHAEGASIGSGSDFKNKSKLAEFYGMRGKMLFVKEYYSVLIPYLFLTVIISALIRLMNNKRFEAIQSIKMFYIIFIKKEIPKYK